MPIACLCIIVVIIIFKKRRISHTIHHYYIYIHVNILLLHITKLSAAKHLVVVEVLHCHK